MNLLDLVGVSALVAAVTTILGAVFLVLFFAKGQPWGSLNDLASIVLMLAMVPVAIALGRLGEGVYGIIAWGVTGLGVVGMLSAALGQSLLLARVYSYESLLPWTLGSGAIVGVWYVLVGILGLEFVATRNYSPLLIALAIASGIGFISLGFGFLRGNERHPLSIAGGFVVLVASTGFLGWIGFVTLLTGPV